MPNRPFARAWALGPVVLTAALMPVARAQQPVTGARPLQIEAAPQARPVATPNAGEVARRLEELARELSALGQLVEARGSEIRCACPIGPPSPPIKSTVEVPRGSLAGLRRAIEALAVIERNAQVGQDTEVEALSITR
jgi:hypothetical protein